MIDGSVSIDNDILHSSDIICASTDVLNNKSAENPDLSIILATKDRANLLDQMLTSLGLATCGITCEVVVIAAESHDNTMEVLQDHGVAKIFLEANHLGTGRHSWPQLYNFGFAKAKGRWAMYASDDIVFCKGSLSRAVSLLDDLPKSVAGGIFFYRDIYPESPDWGEDGICFSIGNHLLMNYGLIRMDFFREVEGLDEGYAFYQADSDFSLKAAAAGKPLVPLPGCYLVHNNILDRLKQGNQAHGQRDTERLMKKWDGILPINFPFPYRISSRPDYQLAYELPWRVRELPKGVSEYWRALSYMQRHDYLSAIDYFDRAIDGGCSHWIVLWYMSVALAENKNLHEAKRLLGIVEGSAQGFEQAKILSGQINQELEAKLANSFKHTPADQLTVTIRSKKVLALLHLLGKPLVVYRRGYGIFRRSLNWWKSRYLT